MASKESVKFLFTRIVGRGAVGLLGLLLLYLFGTSMAQQPDSSNDLPASAQLPPSPLPQQPDDYKNDPLFQEIQRIYLNGSNSLAPKPSDSPGLAANSEPPKNAISTARWHAVESILSAARALETEVTDRTTHRDLPGATKAQAAIDNLRNQALELLNVAQK